MTNVWLVKVQSRVFAAILSELQTKISNAGLYKAVWQVLRTYEQKLNKRQTLNEVAQEKRKK